jgi:hypothetical protein
VGRGKKALRTVSAGYKIQGQYAIISEMLYIHS